MRAFLATAMALLMIDLTVPAAAQVQPQLNVGAFGGWSDPLPPLKVPPTLRQFVPERAVLRAIINTQMAPDGEICLLYDQGDNSLEVHLDVVHAGKATSLFDTEISGGVAGIVPFTFDRNTQMLAFAYHVGGDCSDTSFAIFAVRAGTYQKIFENQTEEGRMKIFEDSTEHIEVWSASYRMTVKNCIWCPHRYRVESYSWQSGQFKRTHTRRTSGQLEPSEIAGTPFILQPARQAAPNPSQPWKHRFSSGRCGNIHRERCLEHGTTSVPPPRQPPGTPGGRRRTGFSTRRSDRCPPWSPAFHPRRWTRGRACREQRSRLLPSVR